MKRQIIRLGIVVACILISFCTFFISCTDDVNAVIKYVGKVVYAGTTNPFADLEVKVTNGEKIHNVAHTDETGTFSINVKVEDIDGSYYVLIGDSSCVTKKMELSGYGQAQMDLGTIEIEGPTLPAVTTKSITNISDNTATSGGLVTTDGRSSVTARGVCWSKSEYPTIDDEHTQNGSGLGEFKSRITNLEANATYYVRAYAINRIGTAYGEQLTLTSMTGLPQVVTNEVSNIQATTATCGGNVALNSGYAITARGICWSEKTATPTVNNAHTEEVATTGKFSSMMIGLERNTTYFVRAYATNEKGTNYGGTQTFTTLTGLPTVITANVSDIKAITALCGGDITANGGYTITARGVCWSKTSSTPTIEDNHTNEVADNGVFNSLMTGLEASTTYYVRAYATNEVGTSYGGNVIFTTQSGLPVVKTTKVSDIKAGTASCGGTITNDEDYTLLACGVCWSKASSTPTIEDSHTNDVSTNGVFSSLITGLEANTTYYIRAYATNTIGTAYGDLVIATTAKGLPTVTTTIIGENITQSTAISGGQVTDDGGFAVTARGVCWNTLPYPTINDNKTTDGSGTGYYTSTITDIDLTSSNTYYIRAYATNQNGTTYGEQILVNKENWEYKNLPTIEYGGYTYRIYQDIGAMTWDEANTSCENLVYGGYDDWFLPSTDELSHIMTYHKEGWYDRDGERMTYYTKAWGQECSSCVKPSAYYWTCNSSPYSSGGYETLSFLVESYSYYNQYSGTHYVYYHANTPHSYVASRITSCRVRPIRKYLVH